MKTREEVEALKENWKNDPCWDIEDTEEFEEYHDELLAFSNKYNRQKDIEWEMKREIQFRSAAVHRPDASKDINPIHINPYDGLTKLELYSAMAMQSLIQTKKDVSPGYVCKLAVEYALRLMCEIDTLE